MAASRAKTGAARGAAGSVDVPTVALIGLGNWGSTLALALSKAGVPLCEIIVRSKPRAGTRAANAGRRWTLLRDAALDADVFWICAPDRAIASIAKELADRLTGAVRPRPPVVFHSSGALGSAELGALHTAGASIASVHPLMTFPTSSGPDANVLQQPVAGVPFAIEGEPRACRAARRLVRALGGEPFLIAAGSKPLHHAYGALASPLLVALLTAAMETAIAAGYSPRQAQRRMRPIVERTVSNFFANGPAKGFSGPIARGDAGTVGLHLEALRPYPALQGAYRALALFALDALPTQDRDRLRRLLKGRR